jgi:DNA modification methylase
MISSAELTLLTTEISQRLGGLRDPQRDLPRAAKDPSITALIAKAVQGIPTWHQIHQVDARDYTIAESSVQLALTSPPYWTLKEYRDSEGQLGHLADYESFLTELDRVWQRIFDGLIPGGRLVCVVGDVCLSRRRHGRHHVVALHASIQEHARAIGFDNLAPIFWHKISNAKHEVERGGGFLGKPYEPNAVIKNDIEYILMFRKPGGYRTPSLETRLLSLIPEVEHRKWFTQVWTGLTGASTRNHPAPYPLELAERLVRMFSFVGDTVLDPFTGTATTNLAAARWGRNSIGLDVDGAYAEAGAARFERQVTSWDSPAVLLDRELDRVALAITPADTAARPNEEAVVGVSAA